MATNQPKPPKPTVYAKNNKKGLSSLFDSSNTQNFITDFQRGNKNLGSSIEAWLQSRDAPKYGAGDYQYGINPGSQPATKKAPQAPYKAPASSPVPTDTVTTPDAPLPKTLADYIAQARGMGLGGGDGTNYDALSGQLRANGAAGDAKLAAMYDALARSTAGDSAGIQTNFDNAGSKMAAASATANKDTAQAYNSTRDAQTAQFNALGIGDSAGVLAANGGQAARDQNIAQANIAQNGAANQNQNTGHAANAQQYNTGVLQSNRSQGAEARSRLQQQLSTKLAELESAKATAGSNGAQQAFSAALQLMQMDPQNPSNMLSAQNAAQDRQLSVDSQAAKIQKTLAETTKLGSAKTLQQTLAGSTGAYQKVVKLAAANGINTGDTKAMSSFIQSLVAAGKLG